jgi:hypothetical protein
MSKLKVQIKTDGMLNFKAKSTNNQYKENISYFVIFSFGFHLAFEL